MPVICVKCSKNFCKQSILNRHVREVHEEAPDLVSYDTFAAWSSRCLENDCGGVFKNYRDLIDHLQIVHSMKFETQSYLFGNMNGMAIQFFPNSNFCNGLCSFIIM